MIHQLSFSSTEYWTALDFLFWFQTLCNNFSVKRVVFLTDVQGVFDRPPHEAGTDTKISETLRPPTISFTDLLCLGFRQEVILLGDFSSLPLPSIKTVDWSWTSISKKASMALMQSCVSGYPEPLNLPSLVKQMGSWANRAYAICLSGWPWSWTGVVSALFFS